MGVMATQILYYTLAEAAQALRCDKRTIRRWIKDGLLPYIKPGRKFLFRVTDIQNLPTSRPLTREEVLK